MKTVRSNVIALVGEYNDKLSEKKVSIDEIILEKMVCETASKEQSLVERENDVLSLDKHARVDDGRTTPATTVHDAEPTTSMRGACGMARKFNTISIL
jgi:hypothetical protein